MPDKRNVFVIVMSRVLVSLALIAAAIGVAGWLMKTKPEAAESDRANQLRRVTVVDAIEAPVGRRVRGYGTARAVESADVPARVGATVVELGPKYREGECVAAGELLVRLDESDFRRQLEMAGQAIDAIDSQLAMLEVDERTAAEALRLAEADAAIARADVARAESAEREGAAKEREVDLVRKLSIAAERSVLLAREASQKIAPRRSSLQAERSRQEAVRQLASDSLDRCAIRSPIDGVLQSADKEIGEMVGVGSPIARVVNTSRIEVPALLPASARLLAAVGHTLLLMPDREGAPTLETKVTRVAPEDDPATRTFTIYAEIDGSSALPPGTFVEVSLVSPSSDRRTVLPRRSVSEGRVYVVERGRVHVTPVEVEFSLTGLQPDTGLPDSEWLVLRESLPPGTQVVLDASRQIPDGTAIEAERPASASASAAKAEKAR
jgi:membrane fusion protein (multidrug efflux system)